MEQGTAEISKDLITVDIEGNGIATVTINRPNAMNSLTHGMMLQLASTFISLDQNDDVQVIIFTGSGRGFCAGVDLGAAQNVFQGDMIENFETDPVLQLGRCRKPVIGAVNGFAITGGFELALACDILIASTDAKFIDTHSKFGIHPSWGLSAKLSRLVGVNRARHVSLTCMPIDAQLAYSWGIVSKVVPPSELMKTAHEIAKDILKCNNKMILKYKLAINDGFKLPFGQAIEFEKANALQSYAEMTVEDFEKMAQFNSAKSSKSTKVPSKL